VGFDLADVELQVLQRVFFRLHVVRHQIVE